MERITSYLGEIVHDLNSLDKKQLHLWSRLCSHGQFPVTDRRMLIMASTSFSFKKGEEKAMFGHNLSRLSYQYPMGVT
eukprot:1647765-Pyramimonas_sp.AAC.1